MKGSESKGVGRVFLTGILVAVLALGACVAGILLKGNDVDSAALSKIGAAQEKFNVVRFQTSGPEAEQYFGYFLYKDGIEVLTGSSRQVVNMGKMTLGEVMADYDNVRKTMMYSSGSGLIVREISRWGSLAGYVATDRDIDVGIWDVTPGGKESGAVLQLVFDDTRGEHGIGTYRGRPQSGD